MNISFEQLSEKHRFSIMDIFNYYIENSFSAYSDNVFDYDFYNKFIENTKGFPAYAIKVEEETVGFCYLSPYNPLSSFRETPQALCRKKMLHTHL